MAVLTLAVAAFACGGGTEPPPPTADVVEPAWVVDALRPNIQADGRLRLDPVAVPPDEMPVDTATANAVAYARFIGAAPNPIRESLLTRYGSAIAFAALSSCTQRPPWYAHRSYDFADRSRLVALGPLWFVHLCAQDGREVLTTYVATYSAARPPQQPGDLPQPNESGAFYIDALPGGVANQLFTGPERAIRQTFACTGQRIRELPALVNNSSSLVADATYVGLFWRLILESPRQLALPAGGTRATDTVYVVAANSPLARNRVYVAAAVQPGPYWVPLTVSVTPPVQDSIQVTPIAPVRFDGVTTPEGGDCNSD